MNPSGRDILRLGEKGTEMEITFSDLWKVFKKCVIVMLVCAILAGGVTFFAVKTTVQKVYATSFTMNLKPDIASSSADKLGDLSQAIAVGNALLTSALLNDLRNEVTARRILEICAANKEAELSKADPSEINKMKILENEYDAAQLSKYISVAYNDAVSTATYHLSVRVTVKAHSAHDCGVLAAALADLRDEIVEGYTTVFYFELTESIRYGTQVAPNATMSAILAGAVGFILPYAIAFVLCMTDRRIYSEEDLKRRYKDLSILGQVPTIE